MIERESALLTDIFEIMKTYIPKAELTMAAEDLVRVFDDHGISDGIIDDPSLDGKLKKAIKAHFEMDEAPYEDEYDGDFDDE
jgi:hypothetical protein